MPATWLVLLVLALAVTGYVLGRARALTSAGGDSRNLHSLPRYYGAHVLLMTLVPALGVLALWLILQPLIVDNAISAGLPDSAIPEASTRGLVMSDVRRVADGLDLAVSEGAISAEDAASLRPEFNNIRDRLGEVGVALGSDVSAPVLEAAQEYRRASSTASLLMTITVLAIALLGFGYALSRTNGEFRARNVVESGIKALLVAAASIAILTTLGIVLSLIFNTLEFFKLYPAWDFFFGTTWSPSFGGGVRTWHPAAALGHALHLADRAAGGGADRAFLGDVSVGIRAPANALHRQAAA